jgi:hypothetical protein
MSTGGLSKARLGRMHDVMAGYVERGEVPGLVTLVSRRGELHVDAIGMKAIGGCARSWCWRHLETMLYPCAVPVNTAASEGAHAVQLVSVRGMGRTASQDTG